MIATKLLQKDIKKYKAKNRNKKKRADRLLERLTECDNIAKYEK